VTSGSYNAEGPGTFRFTGPLGRSTKHCGIS
jgi:hypothetical protein